MVYSDVKRQCRLIRILLGKAKTSIAYVKKCASSKDHDHETKILQNNETDFTKTAVYYLDG